MYGLPLDTHRLDLPQVRGVGDIVLAAALARWDREEVEGEGDGLRHNPIKSREWSTQALTPKVFFDVAPSQHFIRPTFGGVVSGPLGKCAQNPGCPYLPRRRASGLLLTASCQSDNILSPGSSKDPQFLRSRTTFTCLSPERSVKTVGGTWLKGGAAWEAIPEFFTWGSLFSCN